MIPRWRLLDCRVEEIEEKERDLRSTEDMEARAESADFRLRIDGLYLLNRLEENRLRPL